MKDLSIFKLFFLYLSFYSTLTILNICRPSIMKIVLLYRIIISLSFSIDDKCVNSSINWICSYLEPHNWTELKIIETRLWEIRTLKNIWNPIIKSQNIREPVIETITHKVLVALKIQKSQEYLGPACRKLECRKYSDLLNKKPEIPKTWWVESRGIRITWYPIIGKAGNILDQTMDIAIQKPPKLHNPKSMY